MATGSLVTGKIAIVMFENFLQTFESQQSLLPLVKHWVPDAADLQNAGNQLWRPYDQHAPIIAGWDLSGLETGIIQQTYPAVLGTPSNDFVSQRIDDARDMQFWKERGEQSARRQASNLNQSIASAMALQASLYYSNTTTNGLDFISEAQALMNERQLVTKSLALARPCRVALSLMRGPKVRSAQTWLSSTFTLARSCLL
jgi:hypothetical protein